MPSWRRLSRLKSLAKPRIRADMSKYNLYNLAHLAPIPAQSPDASAKGRSLANATLFKQTWVSKSMARAYHGEKVLEKKWMRMFEKQAPSVVPMDYVKLAEDDGRRESAGRGSGKVELMAPEEGVFGTPGALRPNDNASAPVSAFGAQKEENEGSGRMGISKRPPRRARPIEKTPHMAMAFWPLERRLDHCIFRALLASSARQARNFVVHGHVSVNGRVLRQPSYLMNPGDLFSVDPKAVMYGLGGGRMSRGSLSLVKPAGWLPEYEVRANEVARGEEEADKGIEEEVAAFDKEDGDGVPAESEQEGDAAASSTKDDPTKTKLKTLRADTKTLLTTPRLKDSLSARQKQSLRSFSKQLRSALSRANNPSTKITPSELEDLSTTYLTLSSSLSSSRPIKRPSPSATTPAAPLPKAENDEQITQIAPLYRPRRYLSAFAFIPRYLEVHQAVCSGVYLRHPQCGPGYAEVPSPYGEEVGRLAFGWYVRRAPRRGARAG